MDMKQWMNEVKLETFHHYKAARTWRRQSGYLVEGLHRKYALEEHPDTIFEL